MDYKYTTLIDVMKNIAEDMSDTNMEKEIARLTSDEIRKFRSVLDYVEDFSRRQDILDIRYDGDKFQVEVQ